MKNLSASDYIFDQPISYYVWDNKYRFREKASIHEATIEATWQRVAAAIAMVEHTTDRSLWQKRFYNILEDFSFLPGGRILAGAGIHKRITLFNCFVMKIKKDSLIAIFDALKEGAITLQEGGGVGYDFSILRPNGYFCNTTNTVASGPVSFMKIWDSMSATMVAQGSRRGAMMANLRCDHPDIEEFITIKSDSRELRQFNLSVIITNDFLQAVSNDEEWPLVFPVTSSKQNKKNIIYRRWSGSSKPIACEIIRTIKAKSLWETILRSAYAYAEPGVIFEDTINTMNTLWYCEWINATNPCGEIPLPPYGACNLGSINLTRFVRNAFTEQAAIDWDRLESTVEIATRFLDNVVDASHYPLKTQQAAAYNTRRIGLGFSGLANIFVMLGLKYGESDSLALAQEISRRIAYITWQASADLGKEKGSFPNYRKDLYLKGDFVAALPAELKANITKLGMRNSHHNAIAPTGSISLLANNISGGIEPIFSARYRRKVREKSGHTVTFTIEDYAYHQWKKTSAKSELPPAWKDVNSLSPSEHLNMQGAIQPYIDNAISKTINLPENFPFEQLTDIYKHAFEMGLKGCTIFRPNEITGSILSDDIDPCCSITSK